MPIGAIRHEPRARVTQIDCLPHAPHHSVVVSVGRKGQNVHIAPAPARVWNSADYPPICPIPGPPAHSRRHQPHDGNRRLHRPAN